MELREALEAVKAYCKKRDDCDGCPACFNLYSCRFFDFDADECIPEDWDIDEIMKAIEQIVKTDD